MPNLALMRKVLLYCFVLLFGGLSAQAQVCYGIAAPMPNVLEISLTSSSDFVALPINQWVTGAVTICWPASEGPAVISSITTTSTLQFAPDASPTMVGSDFCQIYTFVGPSTLNLTTGVPVVQLDAACMAGVEFFINPSPAAPIANGDASLIQLLGEEYAPGACSLTSSGACVPTMGQWLLLSLSLIFLCVGIIFLSEKRENPDAGLLYFRQELPV